MPLPAAYDKNIDSMIADMKNVGPRPGGSITAALFIQRFVNNLPWAHLDIASTAWKKPSSLDQVLPELLDKTLARGWKAVVRASEPERVEHLDSWLWTYRDDSFLPH